MKIKELPTVLEEGSLYVRAELSGSESLHVAGIVTSVFTDLDGHAHYNVTEFKQSSWGSPTATARSYRDTSDLEFISQQRDAFEQVAGPVMDDAYEELARLMKTVNKLNFVIESVDDAINGQSVFEDDSEVSA
jgi:hypothetical protein